MKQNLLCLFTMPIQKVINGCLQSQISIALNRSSYLLCLFLNFRNQYCILQLEIQHKMGQTCNQVEMGYEQPQLMNQYSSKVTPFNPLEEIDHNKQMTSSRFLQSRTNFVKRCEENLSNNVKSRLSQLSDISQFKKRNYQSGHKIYLQSLKAFYYGEAEGGRPKGFGSLEFQNGDYLEGQFVDGRCEGRGRYIKENGSYYQGDFINNVADGYGKYIDRSRYRYQGQWKNNLPNGKGEALYPDQSRYNGQFLNNRRHGKGVLMQRGCIFEGQFNANRFEGQGTMLSDNGESYKGQWKNNQKHGQGEYSWPNGNTYKGQYKEDKRQGQGVMKYQNGQSYDGEWKAGLKHGQGTYKTLRSIINGVWQKGELVQQRKH